jgi:hypothetical protein
MKVFGLLGAVLVLVAGCVRGPGGALSNDPRAAVIVVWRDTSSVCNVTTFPAKLRVYKNEKVRWDIFDTDGCIQPQGGDEVHVMFNKGDGDPTHVSCNKANKKFIQCNLKDPGELETKSYRYSVRFGNVTEDPELQIEQF